MLSIHSSFILEKEQLKKSLKAQNLHDIHLHDECKYTSIVYVHNDI